MHQWPLLPNQTCIDNICTIYAQYMTDICPLYGQYVLYIYICTVYVQSMYNLCIIYGQYIDNKRVVNNTLINFDWIASN